jgi:hypothetical protein
MVGSTLTLYIPEVGGEEEHTVRGTLSSKVIKPSDNLIL